MAEAVGLVLGVAGLFSACVESFDIVARARDFSTDFELICTKLRLLQIRFVLWGEALGLVPSPDGTKLPYNPGLDRPDIRPAVENCLSQLRLLMEKADVVVNRYALRDTPDTSRELQRSTQNGATIFRDSIDRVRNRIRKNQKQKALEEAVKDLLDLLVSITDAISALKEQQDLLKRE
ncbi:prion-inhibition and propagation-domain-containing protein [Xylariaceae sp. FL0016]|nr:prion-inhibition and propagation-domain-containing protein [Xylariaceae sp. FL0016]